MLSQWLDDKTYKLKQNEVLGKYQILPNSVYLSQSELMLTSPSLFFPCCVIELGFNVTSWVEREHITKETIHQRFFTLIPS